MRCVPRPAPDEVAALETDVFGIDDTTAIRYATIARQLLQTPAQQHDPAGSHEPKDPNHP